MNTSPSTPDLTLNFTGVEIQALLGLLDAAVKAQGLHVVINSAVIYQKIQLAIKEHSASPPHD